MKYSLTAICLTLVLSLGTISAAWSADFQKRLAAAESGDDATALKNTTFIDLSYRYSKAPNLWFAYTDAETPARFDTEVERHSALFGLRLLV